MEKRLDKKIKVNFEMYDVYDKTTQQIITIHIIPNISRTKDNQAIKF